MPTFDGDTLVMTVDAPTNGVLTVDVQQDWYKAWKAWQNETRGNLGYPPLFNDSFGGNVLTGGIKAGAYFILQNDAGWRVRPTEENQTIYLVGNLIVADSTLPVLIPTLGGFAVLILGLQPITQNVDTIIDQQTTHVLSLQRFIESGRDSHQAYGSVFYWDPVNGLDTNNGTTPTLAVKTFQAAHNLTTRFVGDVIFAISGNKTGVTTSTTPIKITNEGVSLRGPGRAFNIIVNDAVNPAVWLSAEGCGIEGVAIQQTNAAQPGILIDKHNPLVKNTVVSGCAGDGIELTNIVTNPTIRAVNILENVECLSNAGHGLHIHNTIGLTFIRKGCHFEESGGDGIRIETLVDDVHIIDSILHENTGYGINLVNASVTNVSIINPSYINNVVGNLSDSGTNTVIIDSNSEVVKEIALNERGLDPLTGVETIYELDGVTPKFQGDAFEDNAQTTKYNSNSTKIERRKRLQ